MDEVNKMIGARGFSSSSEVVKQALREYLDECYRKASFNKKEIFGVFAF
jgi:metal-responsive CopG/Arc/MetJ family transcriptional regulator